MYRPPHTLSEPHTTTMKNVRARIENGGERLWRLDDFSGLPSGAVAQALSRLSRTGLIRRLSKGTYYRAGESSFGKTLPNPIALRAISAQKKAMFPAGISAANLLGFTTQASARGEASTSYASLPRKLIGPELVIHTRRPEAWANLSETEAAILDFIRRGGSTSELPPLDTIRRLSDLLSKPKTYARLLGVAASEPPRARAILGALGERIGADRKKLAELRATLNPLSKFDFGVFAAMPNARDWQAKGAR